LGAKHVSAFLTHLAVEQRVSASSQNQALAAILFLYRQVLGVDLPWVEDVVRAKRPLRVPTVLTRDEVGRVLAEMRGAPKLVAVLLYGSGMRLMECMRLRVKDVELESRQIVIRGGKGEKDRVTVLPGALWEVVGRQLDRVAELHAADLNKMQDTWNSRERWGASTRTQAAVYPGSGCSQPRGSTGTQKRGSAAATICTSLGFRRR